MSRRGRRRSPSRGRSSARHGCCARSPACSSPRSTVATSSRACQSRSRFTGSIRASGGGRRARQRHLTPLVGRDEEIGMLMRRWQRARQGDGQFVLIVGEPGLGKSRLLEEFHGRLGETPHTWTEWSFLQLLQNTPLHSITEWGRQRFGGADVPAERRLADLENSLSLVKLDPTGKHPIARAAAGYPASARPRADTDGRGAAAPATGCANRLVIGERAHSATCAGA